MAKGDIEPKEIEEVAQPLKSTRTSANAKKSMNARGFQQSNPSKAAGQLKIKKILRKR